MRTPAVVWIIQGDHWPRASLRAELIERGHEAVGFQSVRDAIEALLVPGQARPAVVVVDLAGHDPGGQDLARFPRIGARLLGIGSAVESSGEATRDIPWEGMLRRPVSLGTIADAVDRLAGDRAPGLH